MNPLRRTGTHRSVACLCIAVVLVAALMPGAAALDYAIPEPGWVLLPDLARLTDAPQPPTFHRWGVAVVPPLPGRAPPSISIRF